ncbi:hypothetical protein I3842_03G128300 [Carya illinoinensis]|uniref:Uncharacterized protein n=1 Tax=Carya illinoinensis TaxID=32201 RepID=A0A922FGQ6_CARIL|nr:hypothetical protein I3842_03G128300 [Carya illinoinensis]
MARNTLVVENRHCNERRSLQVRGWSVTCSLVYGCLVLVVLQWRASFAHTMPNVNDFHGGLASDRKHQQFWSLPMVSSPIHIHMCVGLRQLGTLCPLCAQCAQHSNPVSCWQKSPPLLYHLWVTSGYRFYLVKEPGACCAPLTCVVHGICAVFFCTRMRSASCVLALYIYIYIFSFVAVLKE